MRTPGPLVVSRANPRYFTVDDQEAVYLTGSHIWNNFHDGLGPGGSCAEQPEENDYRAYLKFLTDHGHNFIRLWRWEHFRSQAANGAFHLCMSPQPWPRSGPGTASDGRPAFDLSRFDQAYFDRLRDRVEAAGAEGIYVAVMLFDGWALHLSPLPDNVEGHPFAAANNVNGIGIASIVDYQVLPPTQLSRPSRRPPSARSSTPSRTCPTSCTRWPTSPRAPTPTRWSCPTGRPSRPRSATRPPGSTG
jgi:hypothetical protein